MSISSQQTDTLTFESWQALSETKQRYEIVDGEMIVPPGPSVDHQWISRKIDRRLEDFVEAQGLGIVLAAPLDLLVRREPLRVRQPDILYLNGDRTGLRSRRDIRGIVSVPRGFLPRACTARMIRWYRASSMGLSYRFRKCSSRRDVDQ
jgi:Uma2 family endonuclease